MTTFYEKRGRRYVPVSEERWWDSWPDGFHLVYSKPAGGLAVRFNINPDTAGLLAAAKLKEDALRKVLTEALAMRPRKSPITDKQRKAWEAFQKAMGNDRYIVEYAGVNVVIDAMIAELLVMEAENDR